MLRGQMTSSINVTYRMGEIYKLSGLSNQEFIEKYAKPGCIGLSGGDSLIDLAIQRAERHLSPDKEWGRWSHALFYQGRRHDGHHWVIESDLQVIRKHISLGVQENRATKYHDETAYSNLAIIDFGLNEAQTSQLLGEALHLVAGRTRYSVRELLGTVLALRYSKLRSQSNLLACDHCLFCSAFVQHLFRKIGVDLVPGVDDKHTTPEHLASSPLAQVTYVLERKSKPGKLDRLATRFREAKSRLRKKSSNE